MNETATSKAMRDRDEDRDNRRLQLMHEEFRARYAPDGKRERDQFETHLAMLIREVAMDAQKPFTIAASEAMARRPMPPMFFPKDTPAKDLT